MGTIPTLVGIASTVAMAGIMCRPYLAARFIRAPPGVRDAGEREAYGQGLYFNRNDATSIVCWKNVASMDILIVFLHSKGCAEGRL